MKRLFLFAAFAAVTLVSSQAQNIGAKAGYSGLAMSGGGEGIAGYMVGITTDFDLTPNLRLQPEVLVSGFEGASLLSVPLMAKYYLGSSFSLQAGPQVNLDFGEAPEEFNSFAVALAAGGGFDISDQIFVDARYGFEVTDRYSGEAEDISWKYNMFMLGAGYRF